MAPGCAPPSHQALDALLAGYAAGTLGAPLHALVAGHLALDARSRAFVRTLEAAHATALEGIEPRPIPGCEARLQAIFAEEQVGPIGAEQPPDPVLPAPLVRFFGKSLDAVPWRPLLPGIRAFAVERSSRSEAVLYWIRPGRKFPSHTHEGCEYTLVLKGGFSDSTGHYRRGEIAIADQEIDHQPRADADEDCICYSVADAPLHLTGPLGRLLERLLPHRWRDRT